MGSQPGWRISRHLRRGLEGRAPIGGTRMDRLCVRILVGLTAAALGFLVGTAARGEEPTRIWAQDTATLAWEPVEGAASYRVQRQIEGTTNWVTISTVTGTNYAATLTPCVSQTFRTRA